MKRLLVYLQNYKKETVLATEMEKTYKDMQNNKSISKCLNDLSRRCKVKEINKLFPILKRTFLTIYKNYDIIYIVKLRKFFETFKR